MNRDEYRQAISPLLDQAHELHMAIWALMQSMPGDASKTAEYGDLSIAMNGVGQTADVLYRARYPRPSVLTESVPVDA